MEQSFISTLVVLFFLGYNSNYCTSEPVIPGILLSSLKDIGKILWTPAENSSEKDYIRNILLSPSKSVSEYYSRNLGSKQIQRSNNSYDPEMTINNYIELDRSIFMIDDFYQSMNEINNSIVSSSGESSQSLSVLEALANLSYDLHRPMGLMRAIVALVTAEDTSGILKSFKRRFQASGYIDTCSNGDDVKSDQTYILEFLTFIVAAEIKVFKTVQISSETLSEEVYSLDVGLIHEELEKMHTRIMKTYEELLQSTSQDVWRCDPPSHLEGVTYTKLNHVFKLFIVNEENLSGNQRCHDLDPRFWNTCNDKKLERYFDFVNLDTWIVGTDCPGELWNCSVIRRSTKANDFDICYSALDQRYVYVDIVGWFKFIKRQLGLLKDCDTAGSTIVSLPKPKSKRSDFCFCTSDKPKAYNKTDSRRSERFFYAKPVYADVYNNYVMTGVRLIKKDGIVAFEIQQGKLSSLGAISPSSVSWKAIEPEHFYNTLNLIKIDWTKRSIELQNIDVPPGHVLVGLQIDMIEDRIVLKVLSLPIDLVNGKFNFTNDYLVGNITYSISPALSKSAVDLWNKNIPNPNVKSDRVVTNKYLNFSTSSIIRDVGQTTIPFLDIQAVTTTPMPAGGAGFYFKYTGDFVGYLGIKLRTFKFTQRLINMEKK